MRDELCWVTDGEGGVRWARPAGGRHGSHGSLSRQPQPPVWEETHAWLRAEPRQSLTRCRYNIIILSARWCCNINYTIMSYTLIYQAALKGIPARLHFSYILLLIPPGIIAVLEYFWQDSAGTSTQTISYHHFLFSIVFSYFTKQSSTVF